MILAYLNIYREISPEAVGGEILDGFPRLLPTGSSLCCVISDWYVWHVGVDVRVKFGESMSSRSRDIRLPHFVTNERTTADAGRDIGWANVQLQSADC